MADQDDPLVQALPPTTDYLTYLTLLEYQLTRSRLPTLHRLLQDETLTTNIGWDLVQLLLPMLPDSKDCLSDIARLGNPREVILSVSDALMKLEPEDDHDESETASEPPAVASTAQETQFEKTTSGDRNVNDQEKQSLPAHVLQFNCLVAMLSVLHTRIRTKYPSRFVATSLQAALEAYTLMPTSETTLALLEFFREVSPTKRPAPPPRVPTESSVVRVSRASAPDPEAEAHLSATTNDERALVKKLLQFGLVEVLKSYLLSLSSPMDPGMSWAVRLQEKLHPESRLPKRYSQTENYVTTKNLAERDMIVGRITALSRDLDLNDKLLVEIVSTPSADHLPPLDFEEIPKNPEEIPIERHGALLLLAARAATLTLFSPVQEASSILIYPKLAYIYSNFIGTFETPDAVSFGQPQVLLDSLLALTALSIRKPIGNPADEKEFRDFVLSLTACTARQSYSTVRRIPATVVHSNPSPLSRFRIIRHILEDNKLQMLKDSAIGWLKDEILSAADQISSDPDNIFLDPQYFSVLFPLLFNPVDLGLNTTSEIVASWSRFTQILTPPIHSALSLYYILISSPVLRDRLQLRKSYDYFRTHFLEPLRSVIRAFEADLMQNGGSGQLEAAVGESMCQIGTMRSVGVLSNVLGQVEGVVGDVFDGSELEGPSTEDVRIVEEIRDKTV